MAGRRMELSSQYFSPSLRTDIPAPEPPPPQPYAELEMAADIPVLVFILNPSVSSRAYEEWRPQHFGESKLQLGTGQQQAGVPRAMSNPELYCTSVPEPCGIR